MSGAYMGKILWVDLSTGTVQEEALDESVYRNYLGGYGLGVKLLYERMAPGIDPLGPSNILGFVPGLLTGTGTPFSGRFSVVCKSPLTGGWGDANCGGYFGPELRRCGYDGLFVTGAASRPVYIAIEEGRAEIREAGDLWGLDAPACEEALKKRHGEKWQVSAIGPAGENLVLFAGIVNDRGRLAARSGVGAVMGAKRLKAVAVKGHIPVRNAEVSAFKSATQAIMKKMTPVEPEPKGLVDRVVGKVAPRIIERYWARLFPHLRFPHQTKVWHLANQGTASMLAFSTEAGDAPVRNWRGTGMRDFPFEKARKISGLSAVQFNTGTYACSACPLHCGGKVKVDDPDLRIEEGHRVEYETLAGFGANLLIDELKAIQYAHHLCNQYGLDVISTAGVVAFAFECFEHGLITLEETRGVPLVWSDSRGMLQLIRLITRREGIGAVLADGVKRAAERIGQGAGEFAIHAGGQELPFHDPRFTPSYGTTYQADPTPGRHTAGGAAPLEGNYGKAPFQVELPGVGRFDYANKGPVQAIMAKAKQVQASIGMCEFSDFVGTLPYELMLRGACGWQVTTQELLTTGDRIQALRQAFNCREGIRPGDWRLPDRAAGRPPLEAGPNAGITVDVDAMVRSYYQAMEYDPETGRPSEAKLRRLGLDHVVRDLYGPVAASATGWAPAGPPASGPGHHA